MTVLFADIKSSMELLADRDPEEARKLLDPILELMMDAVHAYEGIVNQVMGDGVMALFGAPLALEDHALRAGYAALRMLSAIARHGDDIQRRHGIPVQIRIGINSGEVLVRSIGSDLDMDYSAIGQTTHLAARLEQMAKPGTALCTGATLRLVEGYITTRRLGAVPVRGLAQPVDVVELTGAEASRLRFHVAVSRGLSPFVGRRREYAAIAQALDRAATGSGHLVVLVGEPGVGKSRLVWEITRSDVARDWLVLEGGTVSYGVGVPYFPVRALLSAYFQIDERDDASRSRERVMQRLITLSSSFAEIATPILTLLNLPVTDGRWAALDPSERRQQTNDAILRLMIRETKDRPVLMVIEDLHWTDRETEALLDALVERLSSIRLTLVVNCRPEYQHTWSSKASYAQLRLEPLDRGDTEALLIALLGADPALELLTRTIAERTGGNPFFIEESVRSLVEEGLLVGEPGSYHLGRPFDHVEVPRSVQAVLSARIDRLSAAEKRVLQDAATIGVVVPLPVLEVVTVLDGPRLQAALIRLREAEFLYESRLYPEVDYAFTHALACDVAYAGMLHDDRRELHRRIVGAMEALYGERRSEHVERLAHHAVRGEVWDKAVTYAREAAAKAAARSAYREAVTYLESALSALGNLTENKDTTALTVDLRLELRSLLFPLGEIARDLESLRIAMPLAERLGDRRRLAWILTNLTRDLSILGQAQNAVETGQRALDLAATVGDLELEVLANAYVGSVCVARGEYRRAVAILAAGVSLLHGERALQRFGLPGPAAVFFRVWLVTALTYLGEFDAAAAHADESLRIARQADQPLALLVAHYTAGFLAAYRGDITSAVQMLETSLEVSRTWRLPAWLSNITSVLGWTYAASGRMDDGVRLMQQAIEDSVATGGMVNHSTEVVRLAEAHQLAGRWDDAHRLGEHALGLARQYQERGHEAMALRLLGEVALRRTPPNPGLAESLFRQAVSLAVELEMQPLRAACQAGLSEVSEAGP